MGLGAVRRTDGTLCWRCSPKTAAPGLGGRRCHRLRVGHARQRRKSCPLEAMVVLGWGWAARWISARRWRKSGCWRPRIILDPAHLVVTGTGLTHSGAWRSWTLRTRSCPGGAGEAPLTDLRMRMFKLGPEGGVPAAGQQGIQPEWFYKGDGDSVWWRPRRPCPTRLCPGWRRGSLRSWASIWDRAGRHRRTAGLRPWGNEFSDHVTEKFNLSLAGPFQAVAMPVRCPGTQGPAPCSAAVTGSSRVRRGNDLVFDKPFLSGEENMSHTIANLEAHQFQV